MRLAVAVLCTLVACGRFGFDASETPPADATPDTPAADCSQLADGTPCDDRSICTDSSTCSAGQCVANAVTGCQVADSQAEFDGLQGKQGWFYGFYLVDGTYDPETDFELGVYDVPSDGFNPVDTFGSEFIYLRSWGVHPQSNPMLRFPVRRWVSDVQGPAIVVVTINKADTSCGDGVEARLMIDGVMMMTKSIAFDDPDGATIPVAVELAVGTKVDAMLSPNDNEACDTTEYTITIASPQ